MQVNLDALTLQPSPTVAFAQRVKRLLRDRPPGTLIDLCGGDAIVPVARDARNAGMTFFSGSNDVVIPYPANRGERKLVEQCAWFLNRTTKLQYGWENLIITPGGKESVHLSLQAIAAACPGGEVVFPTPYWPSFRLLSLAVGLMPKPLRMAPDGGIDLNDLESKLSEKTCAVIINSPRNPDGYVFQEQELDRIIAVAERKATGCFYLADEVYQLNLYPLDGVRHTPLVTRVDPARCVSVMSFSKGFAMAGIRVGFAASHATKLIDFMEAQQSGTTSGASLPSQLIAASVLNEENLAFPGGLMARLLQFRNQILAWVRDTPYTVRPPDGSIYLSLGLGTVLDRTIGGRKVSSSRDFAEIALERGLAVMPNDASGDSSSVRLNLSQVEDEAYLERALSILSELAKG